MAWLGPSICGHQRLAALGRMTLTCLGPTSQGATSCYALVCEGKNPLKLNSPRLLAALVGVSDVVSNSAER